MAGMTLWTMAFLLRMCFVMTCLATFAYGIPQFQNGKYKDIVVVVTEGIKKPEGISQDNIQEFFKEASQFLNTATKEMAAFGEIVIIVPETWEIRNGEQKGNAFMPADIRIDKPNPEYGDVPYTVQQGECGEPGKYIHLTPEFLKAAIKDKTSMQKAARLLVHEWVHLRYGVFDEHSLHQDESSFRWEGGQIFPPTCPGDISGWIAREEGRERCSILCGRVESDCNFYPDPDTILKKSASIMSHPHLENVDLFCNSSNHNKKALFPHNRMCNGMSTYDVIMRHEDFNDKYRISEHDVKPSVIWRKSYHRRIVFVIDNSKSSKKINDTATVFHRPISRFVMEHASSGSYIGWVAFSTTSINSSILVQIDESQTLRDNLIQGLRNCLYLQSDESIGKAHFGIKKGVELLGKEGGMIILTSASESLDDITNVETNSNFNIVVNVIAFGNKTNVKLEDMTKKRGGKYYYLDTVQNEIRSADVDLAIISSVISVSDFSEEPVIVVYERLQAWNTSVVYFLVDEWIGKNTIVTAVWRGGKEDPHLNLTSPSGNKTYSRGGHGYKLDKAQKDIRILIKDIATTGTWKVSWDKGHQEIDVIVTSKPRNSSNPPIRMNAWIARPKESSLHGIERYYRIFAELKMGYDAIVNANVIATFEFVGQGIKYKTLRDDGSPPDVRKNDGIYASYMPLAPREQGRPIVIVRADNRDKIAKRRVGSRGSGASLRSVSKEFYEDLSKKFGSSKKKFDVSEFAIMKSCKKIGEMEEPGVTHYNLPDFDRVAMADSPLLNRTTEDEVNQAGPPPIRDLIVKREANEKDIFYAVLQWTVPEDPRPGLKVSKIELRGSAVREMLNWTNFEKAPFNLMVEELAPPGQMQELEVGLPRDQVEESKNSSNLYFFAMKTVDTRNIKGNVSNIAEAFFDTIFADVYEGSEEEEEPDDTKNILIWALSGTGGVILLLLIVIGIVLYLRKKEETIAAEEKSVSFTVRNQ